jgi:predicted dehydrogenase
MIRLGIIGSDNYHAVAFSQLCNTAQGTEQVRGARVVSIYGEDAARTEEVAGLGQIPTIVTAPEEMIGKVDAVLVVLRHGDLHARYAVPFLDAGVPTWVDKPFAIKPDDAVQMLRAASRKGTPLSSFSTLRYAGCTQRFLRKMRSYGEPVTGTIMGANHGAGAGPDAYGGLPFYGSHVVELLTEVFGYGVRDVEVVTHHSHVQATVRYHDERIVNLQFLGAVAPAWHVTAYARDGSAHFQVDTKDCYRRGLQVILRMIRTRQRPLSDDQLLETVRVMDRITRAAQK